jgi:hypothetical protein
MAMDDMRIDFDACRRYILNGGDVLVDGYHQRYEILRPWKQEIKAMFSIQELPTPQRLPGAEDLVVHVRLTDYFYNPGFGYSFEEILAVIRSQRYDRLMVMTDEPSHPFIQRLQSEFAAIPGQPESPLADFAVLMAARRLVMTPSTFSWWAAWLGPAAQIHFPRDRGIWQVHKGIDLWVDDEPRYVAY